MAVVPIQATWVPELKSLARIIFGLLTFRHGLERVLGFPEASDVPGMSFEGIIHLLAFPGGLLLMLGLFTRPVALVLSGLYLGHWFVGPLRDYLLQGATLFGARGPSDPILLNAFFFFYLGLTGAGTWSLDRFRTPAAAMAESRWALYALGALRIVAASLFILHGIPKLFGPQLPPLVSTRFLAGVLECVAGPLLVAGLFTRTLAFIFSGEMAFAYFMTHAPRGFWGSFATPNMEAAILNCFLFLFIWGAGPGAWSLDMLWQRKSANANTGTDAAYPVVSAGARTTRRVAD